MNLEKLFKAQKELDDRIVEEKGLQRKVLLDKKILALQVELGELANEWRGFKFWSEDQKPNNFTANPDDVCEVCKGEPIHFNEDKTKIIGQCKNCDGVGVHFHNPLLEEYVDCLHFILSIGNDIGIAEEETFNHDGRKKEINKTFVDLFVGTGVLLYRNQPIKTNYVTVFNDLLNLGKMLGFTWEQIEQAYLKKNKINHERQASGY